MDCTSDTPQCSPAKPKLRTSTSLECDEDWTVLSSPSSASDSGGDSPMPDAPLWKCLACSQPCESRIEYEQHYLAAETPLERISVYLDKATPEWPGLFSAKADTAAVCAQQTLTLFSDAGYKRRVALWERLSLTDGQDGITHNVLFQTLNFMIHWALCSPSTKTTDDYDHGRRPGFAPCTECYTKQIVYWEKPTREEAREHDMLALKQSVKDQVKYPSIDELCNGFKAYQVQMARYMCLLRHNPDPHSKQARETIGKRNQLGIPGRYQWSHSAVACSTVLQAIDMVIMILSVPEYCKVDRTSLPVVVMLCLLMQLKGNWEDHGFEMKMQTIRELLRLGDRVHRKLFDDSERKEQVDRSALKAIERMLFMRVFDMVLPGFTDVKTNPTDASTWMPASGAAPNGDIVHFNLWEDRVAESLFELFPNAPWLDTDGTPLFTGCNFASGPWLTLKPTAYPKLFHSYTQRREWIVKRFVKS